MMDPTTIERVLWQRSSRWLGSRWSRPGHHPGAQWRSTRPPCCAASKATLPANHRTAEADGKVAVQYLDSALRFADSVSAPCAFVLSHQGKVVYASRSKALKDANAYIARLLELPAGSVSQRSRAGEVLSAGRSDAADWFDNWERGGTLVEEARHLAQWDQTLTLIYFESGELPSVIERVQGERRWEVEGRQLPYCRED